MRSGTALRIKEGGSAMTEPTTNPPAGFPAQPETFGPPPEAPARTRDPLGVITFVLGLLGFLVITVPVALILGVAALARIRRTGRRGRGLAVAGLTLAVLWAAGFAALIVSAADEGPKRSPSGQIESPATVRPDYLKPGDCVTGVEEGDVDEVQAVPCDKPGVGEVFAVFELTEKSWPGEARVADLASERCSDSYKAPSGQVGQEPDVMFIVPTEDSWKYGDRSVVCIATPAK